MLIDHQRNNRTRSRRSEALARNQRQEQQTAVKQTLWWLAAGTAVAALSFAFTTQARAQITPTPASEFNQMETYACSAESQALLSQVELMKVAGGQLRQRWAEQGFAVGQHMPDNGSNVFAGAQQMAAYASAGLQARAQNNNAGVGGFGSGTGYAGGGFGHGGMGSATTVSYGSLFQPGDEAKSAGGIESAPTGTPTIAAAPTLTLPASITGSVANGAVAQPTTRQFAAPQHAAPQQAPSNHTAASSFSGHGAAASGFGGGMGGGAHGLTPEIHQGLMAGDPAAVRTGLNAMLNSVDPIDPNYERFFEAHPSMKTHLAMAQEMGVGPGPIIIDPHTVARQFGVEYDGQMLDTYSLIPPNTGSALSRLAMGFRSFFYSQ